MLLRDQTLMNLLIRFITNLVVLVVLVGVIYYKFSKKEEYVFSLILIGISIFLLCSILGTIELKMGTALGLFAVFAILRFRTVQYSVKDITYFFVVIGVSVINSQANIHPHILGAILINTGIILVTWFMEIFLLKKSMDTLLVVYHKIDLLKPGHRKDLIKDLSHQTGQNIENFKIRRINTGKGTARIDVYFKDKETT
jgi:hypothetical protein